VRHCPVQRVKVAATTCTLEAGNALNLTLDLQVSNVTPVIRPTSSRIIAHGTGLQNLLLCDLHSCHFGPPDFTASR
jgi:hypothetical protein